MKNFNKYLGAIAIIAMLFTSCSKEETDVLQDDATATLSFETVLNDLVNNSRQQADLGIPTCMDDEPAYVEVVLTGDENVGTMETPLVVNVHPTPIQEDGEDVWFTQESADLELTPGDYVLTYFAVYNADDEMIWLAPTSGGDLADFVDNPLPLDISLGAGVKKYVDVEVLCFDDRMVNEYGYLFFDIIGKEAFEFCVFANYCDENGRHYPAYYSFEVYLGTDDSGDLLHSELYPLPSTDGEDPSVAPLCFALPNPTDLGGDVPYIYWRATLEDWDDVYGEAPEIVLEGTLTKNIIMSLLNDDGESSEYAHLRFGCDDDNGGTQDSDGDGIPDSQDNCPDLANPDQDPDADCDGIIDSEDNCPNLHNPDQEPDADCDGIIDAEEAEGCVDNPDPNCGEVVVEGCLPAAGASCSTIELSQTVNLAGFPPTVQVPFYQIMDNGTAIGDIFFDLVPDTEIIIFVNLDEGYSLSDIEIDFPELEFDERCQTDIDTNDHEWVVNVSDFGDYPFDVEVRLNVCE